MNNNSAEINALNSKKNRYKNLKSDLKNIVYELKSDDVKATLRRAASSLSENYIINGTQVKSKQILTVVDNVNNYITSLNDIIVAIDSKISSINSEVTKLENANN
jgi:hypothetical protein